LLETLKWASLRASKSFSLSPSLTHLGDFSERSSQGAHEKQPSGALSGQHRFVPTECERYLTRRCVSCTDRVAVPSCCQSSPRRASSPTNLELLPPISLGADAGPMAALCETTYSPTGGYFGSGSGGGNSCSAVSGSQSGGGGGGDNNGGSDGGGNRSGACGAKGGSIPSFSTGVTQHAPHLSHNASSAPLQPEALAVGQLPSRLSHYLKGCPYKQEDGGTRAVAQSGASTSGYAVLRTSASWAALLSFLVSTYFLTCSHRRRWTRSSWQRSWLVLATCSILWMRSRGALNSQLKLLSFHSIQPYCCSSNDEG